MLGRFGASFTTLGGFGLTEASAFAGRFGRRGFEGGSSRIALGGLGLAVSDEVCSSCIGGKTQTGFEEPVPSLRQ